MSRKEGKRTVGYRLTTPAEVALAKRGVEAHRKFAALCKEYERLTERLGELERRAGGDGAKKKRRGCGRTRRGSEESAGEGVNRKGV
jgi:hypothetical protein